MNRDSVRDYWNKTFESTDPSPPESTGSKELDEIIKTYRHPGQRILDFGCGNGKLLYLFAEGLDGTYHGVDLSPVATGKARTLFKDTIEADHAFHEGGAYFLRTMKSSYYDTILLFNILDNMEEEEGGLALREIHRLLSSGGVALVKLNPHLDEKKVADYGMRKVGSDLYLEKNGIYLLNKSDAHWEEVLSDGFEIIKRATLHYPGHDQTNRLFILKKH